MTIEYDVDYGYDVYGVSGNPSVTLTGTVFTRDNKKIIVLAEDAQGRKSSTVKDLPNEFTSTYDANGNLKTEVDRAYYWNCENRLVRLDITDGEKITKLEFAYDFMGRRVSKKVYIKADAESSFVMDSSYAFGYSGFKLIVTFDVQASSVLQAFVWQPGAVGLDIPLSVYDVGDDANLFYLSDANKNIVQLVDATGSIEAKYEYSPFGRITAQSGDYAESNPFRFSSEYHDNETGLVYYNYRYYSPTLGRWINRDSIEESGGWNLYGMVSNNLVNWIDLLGLRPKSIPVTQAMKDATWSVGDEKSSRQIECHSEGDVWNHPLGSADMSPTYSNYRRGAWKKPRKVGSTWTKTRNIILVVIEAFIPYTQVTPEPTFIKYETWKKTADTLVTKKTVTVTKNEKLICECVEKSTYKVYKRVGYTYSAKEKTEEIIFTKNGYSETKTFQTFLGKKSANFYFWRRLK